MSRAKFADFMKMLVVQAFDTHEQNLLLRPTMRVACKRRGVLVNTAVSV